MDGSILDAYLHRAISAAVFPAARMSSSWFSSSGVQRRSAGLGRAIPTPFGLIYESLIQFCFMEKPRRRAAE
jgi:hypothetical protein